MYNAVVLGNDIDIDLIRLWRHIGPIYSTNLRHTYRSTYMSIYICVSDSCLMNKHASTAPPQKQ